MPKPDTLFLQIHALTPFSAVLLNRDDVGRAKRMPFGGSERIRVSSQCQKRHWREVASEWSLASIPDPVTGGDAPGTVRSRETFIRLVAQPLIAEGFAIAAVVPVVAALRDFVLGAKPKDKAKPAKGRKAPEAKGGTEGAVSEDDLLASLKTNQVVVVGKPEVDYLRGIAADLLRERPNDPAEGVAALLKNKAFAENLGSLRLAAGLDAAMFGRMVTSDILARGDGAVHVAHALTVHAQESEPDYFTAIDDLTRDAGELGTGLIQTSELTSGLFYAYVVVDVPLLVSNLQGVDAQEWRKADRGLAATVVEHLVQAIATTSPGAKRGSTAPYGYADLVMVEAGRRQPRSLMTAFHQAVRGDALREQAVEKLSSHVGALDRMYGRTEERRVASLLDTGALSAEVAADGLAGVARFAAESVLSDQT